MSTKAKSKTGRKKQPSASLVWFEVPADNAERARSFYKKLFGWKIEPFRGMTDFWHIDTAGGNETPDGGLMKRKHPGQGITHYISVASVARFLARVKKLGGKVLMSKTAVPQMGYFAVCQDTEKNTFGLWETNDNAR